MFSRKITYLAMLVILLSWPIMAVSRGGEHPVINSGACTATTQNLPRGGEGWIIRFTQTGNTVLRARDLGFPPFHLNDGGYAPVLNSAHHRPVFTCTPNELYVLIYQTERMFGGNESWREIRTQLYRKGIWDGSSQAELVYQTPLSTERIGDENFAIPLTNSDVRIGRAYALTGLVAQKNRAVLFGQFEILDDQQARTSYAALDLSVNGPATLTFESGPADIAQSESVCVTLNELFFVRRIGRLYTTYQVDSKGFITPKLFNWSPVRVECGPGNATIILSSRTSGGKRRRIGIPSTGRGR